MKHIFKNYHKPYWMLVFLRIATVFVPQTGYIHPDEYFQSIEVLAGHFFELEIDKPWEFNSTLPIRSVGVNYCIIGLSYKFLKTCNYIAQYFGKTVFTPYSLIVFPRLFICILSFAVDYALHKLCLNNNENYKSKITILASSYVMVVYATHTFSNAIELILLALLIYYVAESMIFSNIVVKQHEYLNKRYKTSKTPMERAKIHKLRLLLSPHSFKNCFAISSITVIGFFNRPTFLAFAVCPIFFWLYRGIGFKSVIIMHLHYRMVSLIVCAIPTIVLFVIIDSFYYGYLSLAEIEFLNIDINNFVFIPLNFFKYNTNVNNLALHGLHPKYLHFLVNFPLLFNILALFSVIYLVQMCVRFFKGQLNYLPTVRSIRGLMTTTFFVPVLLLSVFPHQEPRFIIPVITPLVYLHAENILPEQVTAIERKRTDGKLTKVSKNITKSNYLISVWLFLNITLSLFYGFVHQGGMYPAIADLSHKLRTRQNSNFHIVTSHMYSIPESLFLQKSTEKLYAWNTTKFKLTKRVKLYQEGSKDMEDVLKKLNALISVPRRNSRFYFVYPSSLKHDLFFHLKRSNYTFQFASCNNYFPHLSTEALPHFHDVFNVNDYFISQVTSIFYNIKFFLSLSLCKIE